MDCGNLCFHFFFSGAYALSPNGGHCPDFYLEFSFSFLFLSLESWSSNALGSKQSDFRVHAGRVGFIGLAWGPGDRISNKLLGPACCSHQSNAVLHFSSQLMTSSKTFSRQLFNKYFLSTDHPIGIDYGVRTNIAGQSYTTTSLPNTLMTFALPFAPGPLPTRHLRSVWLGHPGNDNSMCLKQLFFTLLLPAAPTFLFPPWHRHPQSSHPASGLSVNYLLHLCSHHAFLILHQQRLSLPMFLVITNKMLRSWCYKSTEDQSLVTLSAISPC